MDAAMIYPGSMHSAGVAGQAANRDTASELRENFMTMLVTQLRNQDPLNPLENNELTTQLAQISTVSGVDALNETLRGIDAQIEAGQSLQAAALIDRGVLVPGDHVLVGEDGVTTPFGIELAEPAQALTASIIGRDGQVLYSQTIQSVKDGVHSFAWDGELPDGEIAAPGAYRVEFEVANGDNSAPKAVTLAYALVRGVSMVDGAAQLDLGGIADPVRLEEVRQIL